MVNSRNVTLGLYDAVIFSYLPKDAVTTTQQTTVTQTQTQGSSTTTQVTTESTTLGAGNIILSFTLLFSSLLIVIFM
jgi:hypothetical protein